MIESKFAKTIIDALKSIGCWTLNIHGHRFQKSGVPDIYVAHPRWSGWIEFKVGNREPTDLQIIVIKDLMYRGVPAFVVRLRDGVIYCELWYGGGKVETLAYSEEIKRIKGVVLGKDLIEMFVTAGNKGIEMMKESIY